MKIRFLNLLLAGSIVISIMLSGCKKDDNTPLNDNDTSTNNGTLKDNRDGKTYKWVKIGNQIWMAENLNYTGSDIQHITDKTEWENNSNYDGWCYYENNEDFGKTYGVLYQWEAAKKACPEGWHLPSYAEWNTLKTYLGTNAGSKLAGNAALWTDGALDQNADFGSSGFSALPGGFITYDSNFSDIGNSCFWWSATNTDNYHACLFGLEYDETECGGDSSGTKPAGLYVRCVKD